MRHALMISCALVALAANNDSGGKAVPTGFKGLGKKETEVKPPEDESLQSSDTPDVDGEVDSANTSETEKAQSTEAPLEEGSVAEAKNAEQEAANQQAAQQTVVDNAVDQTAPIKITQDTEVVPPRPGVVGTLSGAGVDTVTFHGEAAKEAIENKAEQDSDAQPLIEDDGSVLYSSHPIVRLGLGEFQFENSQLRVEADKVAEFDELISKQPPQIRGTIRKIDVGAANSLIASLRQSRMTSGVDTSANSFGFSPKQQA